MSKRAFVPVRTEVPDPKPVRVAPKAPHALPDREPRNMWVIIGIPALIVGLLGTIVMLYVSGNRSLQNGFFPLLGIGAFMMLMFSGRFGRARKISWGEQEKNRRTYLRELDGDREQIQKAVGAQRASQERVHSNPLGLGAIVGGPRMWERRRSDPDFLDVRLGVGVQNAPDSVLSVTWPDIPIEEELEPVTGQALRDFILEQRKIRDIAKVLNLRSQPGFSFVGEDLDRVRSLMRSVLCSLAVFHSPSDVKLMVVTRNPDVWSWMVWLPHNQHDELFDACGWRRLVFQTPGELEQTLAGELHMKGKRGAWKPPTAASPTAMASPLESPNGDSPADLGPHWVIVDDNTGSPEAWESVVGQVGKERITVLRVASRVGTGVGFGKDQVFELGERVSGAAESNGSGTANGKSSGGKHSKRNGDARPAPAPLLRTGGKFFAHADQLSTPRAYRYARAMARWSSSSATEVTDSSSGAAELQRALGIADPRELDVDRLWAERRGRGDARWSEIPVGAKPNGELQNIIFRAKDFGGFGFHSVVIGTSGSGKSEFFLSLAYGVALTHSPETFNIIFVDMKFDSAAQDIHGIPHSVAALSNMGKDDRHLAERMRKTIQGEIKRRYELFNTVGARDANDYEEIRLAGRDLEPVPVLLVIIDEYLELFTAQPKWIDLIIHIAQVGRGANVFFMLGGQRLDLSSLMKVKHSIAFRIALRAESGDESREVIGSDAAFHLPSKENGFGLLKVGPRDLEPFRCFYLSAPFVVPKQKKLAKTIDMTLTKPRLYNWEYQPLDEQDAAALAEAAAVDDEPDEFVIRDDGFKKMKIVDVYRESLMAVPHKAPRKIWLPPLEKSEPVDELVRQYRGKDWHVDYGRNAGLVFPLGIMDIPEEAKQQVFSIDVLRDNIMVVGAKSKGKTTTLMTMMCSAALMYTPARVTFFCIGGASLNQVSSLPHVADIISPNDNEGVVRTVASMERIVNAREDAFRRTSSDINEFREQRFGPGSDGLGNTDPSDRFGDVFLVIDDFADLYSRDTVLGDRIVALSGIGPQYGVHVVATGGGWTYGQRGTLVQNSNVKIQLRLAEPGENQMNNASMEGREAARKTLDLPGFALTNSLHELLIGVPEIVGRDGQRIATRDIGKVVAEVSGTPKHATLMRLPKEVALAQILEFDRQQRPQRELSIAFAIGEQHELRPVPISLRDHPGMMIMGRQGCGKSSTLMAIGEAVMDRFSPDEARLTIIDPKVGPLQNLIAPEYVHAYAYEQDEIDEVITHLAREILLPRRPPTGLSQEELRALKPWEGPRHFVLIDDVQDLRPAQSYPGPPKDPVGSALWKLMESPRAIGLHVFTTRSGNWATMEMDPWVRYQRAAKVAMLYMDNDPQQRISQTIRAQALPAGRGLLMTDDTSAEGVLVGIPSSMSANS
ncbi:type VII secretion protein EccCa [Mycolicibacterium novocastrense]|uniref:DNA translocase FtsK n=1 Tax=Mycolicibacterium novocastrense TaxID=59813 RepID=A0AAW5ST43_MYCNV|nr:type VII secretion protein EccCa [Mycolicibacterium novocastrense]MCV7026626.1 type VII secretion protein EccCa [Mycolicibacterium novocastrense]GAT07621.1 DNA translocase FtsK [Mycolicibacterium novocastrense]